jgi:UDP-N-acetylglucosamine 2-epimerase (non-hydrolysing)
MGTRPEIIKMAPLYRALRETGLTPVVVHTGQQDALAYPLYRSFGMMPDVAVDIQRTRDTLGHLTAHLVEGLDVLLGGLQLDALLVHGATTGALSAALAASYRRIPVGHVEAGLRSGHTFDPFPEEQNRHLLARLATWHFAPTPRAVENLVLEGIAAANIHLVGSTGVDAAHWAERQFVSTFTREGEPPALVNMEPLTRKRLVLVTAHRPELRGEALGQLAATLAERVRRHADLAVVWPTHPDTDADATVRAAFDTLAPADRARVLVCEPLAHPQLLWLLRRAWLVMTDSGALQEEAAAFGRPLMVLRSETERPELVEAGAAVLAGTDAPAVGAWLDRLTTDETSYGAFRCAEYEFGDGRAATYVANLLEAALMPEAVRARRTREPEETPAPEAGPLRLAPRWSHLAEAA